MFNLLQFFMFDVVALLLLLFDVVAILHYSCSKVLIYSSCLKLLFCSSYSTCCSILLSWPTILLVLLDLLFLLNVVALLVLCCYSILFAQRCYSSCSTLLFFICSGTSLLWPWFCYSLFFLFQIGIFASVKELLKFKIFRLDLEGDNFFKFFCLLMSFFNYPCFREMVVDNVFVYCV